MDNKKEKINSISRGKFLKEMGFGGASLMAFYCMGTLSSCSKSEADPAPATGGNTNTNTKIDITIDLTTNDFKGLKTDGEFAVKDNIIVANSGGKYAAISKVCTHEGTTIAYRKANSDFRCPNHGATFNTDGTVKGGPNGSMASTISALKVFKTEILDSGNKLRIFE